MAIISVCRWKALLLQKHSNVIVGFCRGGAVIEVAGVSLLYVAAGLALWSLAVYIKAMWKQLAK